ncbi:MAG: tetratricopeptide repeat protein [Candidatus Obscuribacterales bacterium]|jgi:tetratricopeptide (TPR) repeat protein|nr:tetratricopeptide repeat protein [Candidatus Obscuribacterales bacterium]
MKAHFVTAVLAAGTALCLTPAFADPLEEQITQAEQYYEQGDKKQSEKGFDAVLSKLAKASSKEDQTQLARVLNNLAVLYNETNRNPKAEEYYKRALGLREKLLGPNTMEVAITLNNLANLYKDQKQFDKAEPLYRRAMAIGSKLEGPESSYMAMCHFNMASFYKSQNKLDLAVESYKKSLSIGEKVMGPDNSHVMDIVINLAELYDEQGKTAEAKPLFMRYLKATEPLFGIKDNDPNRTEKLKKVVAEMRKDKEMIGTADRLDKAISYQSK